jgi:hypothetical protein
VPRGAATKADLHDLVEALPEQRVETARRLLESLSRAEEPTGVIARFLETMDGEEAAILDALADLDADQGAPPFVAEPNERQ